MASVSSNQLHNGFISPKCGAKTRKGSQCPNFARQNGRCRRHGGLSTGPRTEKGLLHSRHARWKHGEYSAEAKAEWRALRQCLPIFLDPEAAFTMTMEELQAHNTTLRRLLDKRERGLYGLYRRECCWI